MVIVVIIPLFIYFKIFPDIDHNLSFLLLLHLFHYLFFFLLFLLPDSLTESLSVHPLARLLFHGGGSAGHCCVMSSSERSQGYRTDAEPPLSFSCSPMLALLQLLSLCLPVPTSPAPQLPPFSIPPPPFTSHESLRLTASPKSESWNRWNMNGSLVYEKGVWVKEVE